MRRSASPVMSRWSSRSRRARSVASARRSSGLSAPTRRARSRSLENVILREACGMPLGAVRMVDGACGVFMLPIPGAGILRGVHGVDRAEAVAGVTGVTISIPIGERVRPLPEGDRYLGFVFARGDTPGAVEASLRQAQAQLGLDICVSGSARHIPTRRESAPWRNRTSLNRLKAGCSTDELRGPEPGLYCRPCGTPYHRHRDRRDSRISRALPRPRRRPPKLALPRGVADLPGLASGILRPRAPARFDVEVPADGPTAGRLQSPQQHRPVDLRRLRARGPCTACPSASCSATRSSSWILAGCNCFPVDRGAADRRALRTALDVLSRRGRLLIFLEGTRSATPGMRRAEAGVGFLARRSGASILPVGVWGTEAALPRGRRLPRRVPIRLQARSGLSAAGAAARGAA